MKGEIDWLAAVVAAIAQGAEPHTAANDVVAALCNESVAESAHLYLIDLSRGEYALYAQAGPHQPPTEALTLKDLSVKPTELSGVSPSIRARADGATTHRLPITRGSTLIGILDLVVDDPVSDPTADPARADTLSAAIIWIYEHRFASRLLGGIQTPIPYDQNQDWFLSDILRLIRQASGMAYVAVRERTDAGDLRCLAASGFDDSYSQDALRNDLTFTDVDIAYPAFAEAMERQRAVVEMDMTSDRNAFVGSHSSLADVQSYVVTPIKVGSGTFGTLSLATTVRYPFTDFELQGFESIANGIGVAITNFRNHHDMADRYGDIAVGVSALEIATSVRHATVNILDRCDFHLDEVERLLTAPPGEVTANLNDLRVELKLLAAALQRFKVATETPTRIEERVSLREEWEGAKDVLQGRMDNLKVHAPYDGPDLVIVGYKDWIGHLFLNLLINSMDAFDSPSTKRRGREARLRVNRPVGGGDISVYYTDNATGIQGPRLLGGPSHVSQLPVSQRIFEPHVTSKRDPDRGYLPASGSGLGLFLVRKVVNDHGGSIDLVESHAGAKFRITLPSDLLVE